MAEDHERPELRSIKGNDLINEIFTLKIDQLTRDHDKLEARFDKHKAEHEEEARWRRRSWWINGLAPIFVGVVVGLILYALLR